MAGMNFLKKSVIHKKIEKKEKGLKQLSDPPEKILVEMVGGSDRPAVPPAPQGLQAQMASKPGGPSGPEGLQALKGLQAQRVSRPGGPRGLRGFQAQKLP